MDWDKIVPFTDVEVATIVKEAMVFGAPPNQHEQQRLIRWAAGVLSIGPTPSHPAPPEIITESDPLPTEPCLTCGKPLLFTERYLWDRKGPYCKDDYFEAQKLAAKSGSKTGGLV